MINQFLMSIVDGSFSSQKILIDNDRLSVVSLRIRVKIPLMNFCRKLQLLRWTISRWTWCEIMTRLTVVTNGRESL